MSKRLRTSFNQFVREKVIQGVDNMYPEAENMPLNLLVPDITSYGGFVEYQELMNVGHNIDEAYSQQVVKSMLELSQQ